MNNEKPPTNPEQEPELTFEEKIQLAKDVLEKGASSYGFEAYSVWANFSQEFRKKHPIDNSRYLLFKISMGGAGPASIAQITSSDTLDTEDKEVEKFLKEFKKKFL